MQLQIFTLKSDYSTSPLAQIRVSGDTFEVAVDNTDGKILHMAGNSFTRLKQVVSRSSHLTLEPSKDQIPNLLRYLLTNGDVVEITTDGLTAVLNGKLLQEEQKQALFDAIRSGELKVSVKADIEHPITIPSPSPEIGYIGQPEKPMIDEKTAKSIEQSLGKKRIEDEQNSVEYDHSIESARFDTIDKSFTKNFAYKTKYGKFRGE